MDEPHNEVEKTVGLGVRPDPDSVTTVADLGRELQRLRASTGGPTLRTLETRAKEQGDILPHSTAGNAKSGRILPRLEVVQAFVRACYFPNPVLPSELKRWGAAWERAWLSRQRGRILPEEVRQTSTGAGTALALPPTDVGLSTSLLVAIPIQQAVDQLTAMDPYFAAKRLSEMPQKTAMTRLLAMPTTAAVVVLVAMDPNQAAEFLTEMGLGYAVEFIGKMAEDAAADRLALMPLYWVSQLLETMHPEKSTQLLEAMPREKTAQLLASAASGETAHIAGPMDLKKAIEILKAMTPEKTAQLLEVLPPEEAAHRMINNFIQFYNPATGLFDHRSDSSM
ncbi:magnesium transporter MgtE N-terminal domain-containing protein [Streptosporangium sp. G11]|uniref:magnesium transporter MgtE N-terminal domain-containing protein n=1 Tax=Streptosporangium sp. G11 TaxID=3436926 RepID=UPI003EC0516D